MGTWIVGTIILIAVILASRKIYKDKKAGKGCGCDNCSGCSGEEDKY